MSKISSTFRLKFIQYNTHLFYKTLPAFFDQKLLHEDENRIKELINRLIQSDADVIDLNEVWNHRVKEMIGRELAQYYKYAYNNSYPEIPGICDIPDNGLLFLCKKNSDTYTIDIEGHEFIKYSDLSSWDWLGKKGILRIDISITYGSGNQIHCHVFITHTQAGNVDNCSSNLSQLLKEVKEVRHEDYPVFVSGDLNTTGDTEQWCEHIKKPFGSCGIYDAYRTVYCDAKEYPGYTSDPKNELKNIFDGPGGTPTRLDYFLVNEKVNLEKSSITVIDNWKYEGTCADGKKGEVDLSDHYPLMATFEFSN